MADEIIRKSYLSFLERNMGGERVKILYGMRGAGKSTILKQFIRSLLERHIDRKQIIYIDFSLPSASTDIDRMFLDFCEAAGSRPTFVLLDGVQMLPHFETLVDRLFIRRNFDIYLAGSGMGPITEPLLKLLPGRCVIKRVYPFSMKEVYAGQKVDAKKLTQFLSRSTIPGIIPGFPERRQLDGLVSSLLLHDVLSQTPAIRAHLLERMLYLMADQAGKIISLSDFAASLGRVGRPLLMRTLRVYLESLESSGLLIVSAVHDLSAEPRKVKRALRSFRFYFSDPAIIGLYAEEKEAAPRLMDAIAVELMRRHGEIGSGYTLEGDIDFLTGGENDLPTLWQYIPDEHDPCAEKKLAALKAADPSFRKVLLTMHPGGFQESNIISKDLISWFMGK